MAELLERADKLRKQLTVTGYTTTPDRRQLLMIYHRKLARWLPPGGHVEPDEFPCDAVIREVKEETGISTTYWPKFTFELGLSGVIDAQLPSPLTMSAQLIPATEHEAEHIHIDMMFELVADPNRPLSEAFDEVSHSRWFTRDEVLNEANTFDAVRAYARERLR